MSTQEEAAAHLTGSKFKAVDYTIFSLMLGASISIGVYSAIKDRHKASTQEFLLGGRAMSPVPVALSLLGGVISAISVLGTPTEVYFFGTQITTTLLGCVLGTVILNRVMLPIFYNLQIVSLSEYLELRFQSTALRKMATLCHLVVNAIYMGMCLYAPALALSTVTNLSTLASMVIMGSICTFYITIGGVKAVVYTDVMQTLLMFGGVLVVVILCCIDLGGADKVWEISHQGSRLEFFNMDTSPFKRHTFWSTFVFGVYIIIDAIAINQSTYQRFASVSTLKITQRLGTFFLVGLCCLWITFFFSGLVAYATYSQCDPLTSGKIEKPDQIIPFLVTDKLSNITGMAGIFVAAVYGAVLSSLSSSGNSVACLVWEDFLKDRPYFRRMSDKGATNVVKLLSLGTGLLAICVGLFVGRLGNIFHVINSVVATIKGPLVGVYIAGICVPMVNTKGATMGLLVSLTFSMWMVTGKFVHGGGSPPRLPLSTQGCPPALAHLVNTSVATLLTNTTLPEDLLANTTAPAVANITSDHGRTMYDISYCYSGVIGVGITVLVGSLVSLCTGPVRPGEVKEGVVNPTCARLYQWLWQWVGGGPTSSTSDHNLPDETTIKMLPAHNTCHHNNTAS